MERRDIPIHPAAEVSQSESIKKLRNNAPDYLVSLIEHGMLENVDSLAELDKNDMSLLPGGKMSAVYFLTNNEQPRVVKFRYGGGAEDEAMGAWQLQGAAVPDQFATGIVPLTEQDGEPVRFSVSEAILNSSGNPALDGASYVAENPGAIEAIAHKMGRELGIMHRAKTTKAFGPLDGNTNSDETLSTYYSHKLDAALPYLQTMGLTLADTDALRASFREINFPEQGTYVHGDFGLPNILVPGDIASSKVIDPNPQVLDHYWDLAFVVRGGEIRKAVYESNREDELAKKAYLQEERYVRSLVSAYLETTGEERLDTRRLFANQIILELPSIQRGEERIAKGLSGFTDSHKRTKAERELGLRKGLLLEKMRGLIS